MIHISEVILVEGRYDKNKLSRLTDAAIIETKGFGIFNDEESRVLLRKLAEERGLIVFTDPDGAGLVIRNYVRSFIPAQYLKHAYVPGISGRERRKSHGSKEGLLGVEGVDDSLVTDALLRCGAGTDPSVGRGTITKADLYFMGLSGRENSSARRAELKKKLNLPANLSSEALLDVLNVLFHDASELRSALGDMDQA